MFDFIWKTRKSFGKVRRDYGELKTNVDGWIHFFDRKHRELEKRMDRIEDHLERIEERIVQIVMMQR